jgi:hypothetical protein
MFKTYLLSYRYDEFQALNSTGFIFILRCERHYFFGLFKRVFEGPYTIPMHRDSTIYFNHWNEIIRSKKPLK